jgi:hypothetical protein
MRWQALCWPYRSNDHQVVGAREVDVGMSNLVLSTAEVGTVGRIYIPVQ